MSQSDSSSEGVAIKERLSKIIQLSNLLQEVANDILNCSYVDATDEETIDPFVIGALAPHLCRLTRMIIPGTLQYDRSTFYL